MNIGITTFQWANNYGALLQAHALQIFLRSRGHEVQIVDYRGRQPTKGIKKWISTSFVGCIYKWEAAYREYLFDHFRRNYLIRTHEIFYSTTDLERIADKFDLLITGSDQVWNPIFLAEITGLSELYFLSFAGKNTRKISYAASFGHSTKKTIEPKWQKILAEKLLSIDAISVREASGVGLVNSICGRTDAVNVVDPTLLLDRSYYEKIAKSNIKRQKYLFSYMLHELDENAEKFNKQIAMLLNLQTLKCDAITTGIHKPYTLPSPTNLLNLIRNASFVVTNSFHGVVFCLLFHTPFIAITIDSSIGAMNSRIVELLSSLGLTHRICIPQAEVPVEIYREEIQWSDIDNLLDKMRVESIKYFNSQGL